MEKKEKVFILKESEVILLLKVTVTLATLGHLSKDDVEKLKNLDEDLFMYAMAAARASRMMNALNEAIKEILKDSEEDCED